MDLITLALAKKYTEKRVTEISGEGPSGVQPDWNQNDETAPDYVKNRTHYDSRRTEEVVIEFDGVLEGKEHIDLGNNEYFVKVSNEVPTNINDLIGGNVTIYTLGGSQTHTILEEDILLLSDNLYDIGNGSITVAYDETTYNSITLTKGIYFIAVTDGTNMMEYVQKLPCNTVVSGELKQLDEKYLPDGIGVQSDWTVKDQTSKAYILNKPAIWSGTGDDSIIEGYSGNVASNDYSHAEGEDTTASGGCSHAEGSDTTASGSHSHAEGNYTKASGIASHAEGEHTVASGNSQHVQGKYNIEDTNNKYAHIVGNGYYDKSSKTIIRLNAHTLDWSGNAWYQGSVYVGGNFQDIANAKKLATEEFVNQQIINNVPEQKQVDWNQTDETASDFIKNRPDLDAMVREAKSHSDSNLEIAKTYTDNAVVQKTQVQIITWEAND